MKISLLISRLKELEDSFGDIEVVTGDYEEIVRRKRVKNNVAEATLELITDEDGNQMILISDSLI